METQSDGAASRPEPQENRRPASVYALMQDGDVHPGWYLANKAQNRFYVLNLDYVMGVLAIDYTRARPYVERATATIAAETTWAEQYASDYECSHTQLSPDKRKGAKHFGRAAAIIVAMEIAAREKNNAINVYDWLRILPAQYFVDRLDRKRLEELQAFHAAMSEADRVAAFGEEDKAKPFDDLMLRRIDQEFSLGLLDEIVDGFCVTKYIANKIVGFINAHFPDRLHVGPVRISGQDGVSNGLGKQRAARNMRVPTNMDQDKLGLCQ